MHKRKDLPERVEPSGTEVHAVCITYGRLVSKFKTHDGKMEDNFGGAVARYPRELDFCLDVANLLPEGK